MGDHRFFLGIFLVSNISKENSTMSRLLITKKIEARAVFCDFPKIRFNGLVGF